MLEGMRDGYFLQPSPPAYHVLGQCLSQLALAPPFHRLEHDPSQLRPKLSQPAPSTTEC